MSEDIREKYEKRLARYQAAIALEESDRIPISAGSNYFAEIYAGATKQEFIYNSDNLRSGRLWAPPLEAVGWNLYKLPGRELSPDVQFQFIEGERMKSDEYDLFIDSPAEFIFERILPRVFEEFKERGSMRSYISFLKAGMAAVADGMRGLNGIMIDLFRQPDKVQEACEAIIPHIVNVALAGADPLRRYPIFMPLHRGCSPFLSPEQFDRFYWPALKKAMMKLIDAGYTIRPYLEGDWAPHWHHFRELPKARLILDIDGPADIFKAKEEIGNWQCIAGGIPDHLLILGSPNDVRERVKLVCSRLGKDGGYIINGACGIPYDTKPENYRAMIDAVLEYGKYSDRLDFEPQIGTPPPEGWQPPPRKTLTPWEERLEEIDQIEGDVTLIQDSWEMLEQMAFNWLWNWLW